MTKEQLSAAAADMGRHARITIDPAGNAFVVHCSCGWESVELENWRLGGLVIDNHRDRQPGKPDLYAIEAYLATLQALDARDAIWPGVNPRPCPLELQPALTAADETLRATWRRYEDLRAAWRPD